MKKVIGILGFIVSLAVAHFPSVAEAAKSDAEFQKLADDYLQGYLAWRPQTGTTLGFHEYDGKVTDFSRASLNRELERLRSFDERLGRLETNLLSAPASYDYRILRNAIERERFSFEQMEIYSHNPMTYAGVLDVNIYVKRNFAPLEQRVASITAILSQAPAIFTAARANLAESLPRPQIELAIDQANGAADFLGKDLVDALAQVKNQKTMAEFKTANDRAISELRNYVTYLKEQKFPKANDHYALGREKYAKLLEYGEMVTMPVDQLLEIGLRELQRKQQVFAEAAREIDPDKKPIEVFQAIQKDHPTEQNLISDTARDLDMIRQFLMDHKIISLPSPVRPQVTETPQYLRATSFASMDTPGPFETKATEAYYYVTPPEHDWSAQQKEEWLSAFNYYTTDIVSIHECYPGHYVQFLHLNASPANKLEKIFNSYAFVEGWAHYAEQMMVDEGFGAGTSGTLNHDDKVKAAKYLLAQTDEALLRVCRFCVSIKMHCQGMNVDDAAKFFQENSYYEQKPARQEALRGTFDPEYLYYTLGKLEIFKLREDYRKQQGSSFSLEKFHDEMLRHGAPPVRLLREVMLKDRKLWDKVF
ncbi:MAG TPA: DUF885 domain-containing protein [Verrucomicrobiae bacterium]|nr:DUF885 domain-containing protein [Verrucomicrobiae bacterium]